VGHVELIVKAGTCANWLFGGGGGGEGGLSCRPIGTRDGNIPLCICFYEANKKASSVSGSVAAPADLRALDPHRIAPQERLAGGQVRVELFASLIFLFFRVSERVGAMNVDGFESWGRRILGPRDVPHRCAKPWWMSENNKRVCVCGSVCVVTDLCSSGGRSHVC